jgi:hypothetical protein
MQYKKHPIDRALEALAPILAPSFTLRSYRDKEGTVLKYPLIDYAIAGTTSKVYDTSKNQWRSTYLVIFEVLVQEKNIKDWCAYSELAEAQDKHALFLAMEVIVEQFIIMLTHPEKVTKLIRPLDTIYADLFFKLEGTPTTQNLSGHGIDKLTGIAANFEISCIDSEGGACCLIDFNNQDQLDRLRDLMEYGSVSWNLINQAGGNPPVTACDLIRAQLNTDLLNTCILPLYDFSLTPTQNALSPTQVSDLQAAFCGAMPSTCQDKLDFVASVWTTCIIPALDFTAGYDTDFNALSSTQKSDLGLRICTPCPTPTDYSFNLLGINEYIKGQNGGVYNLEYNNAFSVFTFCTVPSFSTFTILFSKLNNSVVGISFAINTTGRIRVLFINSIITAGRCIEVISVNPITLNDFGSIGFTYDGSGNASGVNIYYKGVAQAVTIGSATLSTTILNTANVEIGSISQLSVYSSFKPNNCRIWNVALNPADAAIEGIGTGGKPNALPVDAANCIGNPNFDTSIFGLDTFSIADDSNASAGFKTINVPFSSRFVQP